MRVQLLCSYSSVKVSLKFIYNFIHMKKISTFTHTPGSKLNKTKQPKESFFETKQAGSVKLRCM